MKHLSILIIAAALVTGCASTKPPVAEAPAVQLFNDSAFQKKPDSVLTADQIFALSPQMRDYVAQIRQTLHGRNTHEALFEALYRRDQLRIEYDSEITRTAAQAFDARMGNCLSLVIMTAALAKDLGLDVTFQRITGEDTWSRAGSLYLNNGHVNLVLGKPVMDTRPGQYDRAYYVTIDFLPPADAERLEKEAITQQTIIAMFMNNRSAEALVQGRLDEAYWWARGAMQADPGFLYSYNTMAIVYQRHDMLADAERVLRFALQRDPRNTITMFNLVQVLNGEGLTAEALVVKAELDRLEPQPPFYYFNLGRKAMDEGDYRKARGLFARELERAPYYHEFHFWMAKAAFELGDFKTADKHMRLAMSNSTTRGDHDLYAAKLDRLRLYDKGRLRPEAGTN
ncbi:tetratricopeptide repeat protein [Pseudoduganella sp. RAF53_2]|uniref:tetratricopeptide repeat protein n=1 Tax=unclassified Pseudoduganella TaxID=2637179 RepID=UPI003F976856